MAQSSPQRDSPAHSAAVAFHRDEIRIKKSWLARASLALIGFAVGGLLVYWLTFGVSDFSGSPLALLQGAAPSAPSDQALSMNVSHNPAIGPQDAPVTLVEFSDFYCVYCKAFHDQTLVALLAKYKDRLRYLYRDFPAVGGQQAAEAASCANDQGAYWAFHNALFSDPHSYSSVDQFASLARGLNLNQNQLRDCVVTGKYRNEVVQDYQAGLSYGVRGTPTFFINGYRLLGAQPLSTFEQIIDRQLGS